MTDAREDRGIGDLVAVQIENRKHRAVTNRVEELVRMPGGRKRARLGFAIADHTRHDDLGAVECHPERMREAVAQLATLVNRAGCFRRDMTADVPRKRELFEKLAE